jgi:1-aminocyclopropane-1-carboxylate deaminase/D-cysteine desulfhydrase-like pyridoxal-dependent ACC family enzyme
MNSSINENNIPLQRVKEDFLSLKGIELYILREDLIHPKISGNKWRKLKYNIAEAENKGYNQILTFGGAFSNHIAAAAAAGNRFGFNTIGIIRGEEILPLNATLQLAKDNGMIFKYISREQYKADSKYKKTFLSELKKEFGEFYLIPEGGSNEMAVKGCSEIMSNIKVDYDVICCACGTGGTVSGIIASTNKEVLGFPALKGGEFLKEDIQELIDKYEKMYTIKVENRNWSLITNYHFGGYAKIKPELIGFIQDFKLNHNILLDLIYTGKMLFGIYDMIKSTDRFDGKKIVVIHTGGMQGNKGFEDRLGIEI